MLQRPDSNRRPAPYEGAALPLGDAALDGMIWYRRSDSNRDSTRSKRAASAVGLRRFGSGSWNRTNARQLTTARTTFMLFRTNGACRNRTDVLCLQSRGPTAERKPRWNARLVTGVLAEGAALESASSAFQTDAIPSQLTLDEMRSRRDLNAHGLAASPH